MSRRCHCRAILADPRVRLLPLAARGLLIQLAELLAAWTEPGGLRMGGRALSDREIALLVSADETEVSNLMKNLLQTGFINRAETDGAVFIAGFETSARVGAARGGRPKRGETAEQAQLRRSQGHLALPLAGGRPETAGKPVSEPSCVRAAATASSLPQEESKQLVQQLGDELAETAGLDTARGTFDYRPIAAWLAAGVSAETIRATIAAVAARPSYRAGEVRGFKYFDPAMRDSAGSRRPTASAAPPSDPAYAAACNAFTRAYQGWQDDGMRGPAPLLAQFTEGTKSAA